MSTYVPPGMVMTVNVAGLGLMTREVNYIEEILDLDRRTVMFYRKIPVLFPGESIMWTVSSSIPIIAKEEAT